MELFREWLLGVVACAMLAAAARQLCPEGASKNAVHIAGGLLILLAMLRPLGQLSPEQLGWNAPDYREAVAQLELELRGRSEKELSDGIAARLAAYIEDKASDMGLETGAEVSVTVRGGVPSVEGVALRGEYSEALAEWIACELGIAKEKQVWM